MHRVDRNLHYGCNIARPPRSIDKKRYLHLRITLLRKPYHAQLMRQSCRIV